MNTTYIFLVQELFTIEYIHVVTKFRIPGSAETHETCLIGSKPNLYAYIGFER